MSWVFRGMETWLERRRCVTEVHPAKWRSVSLRPEDFEKRVCDRDSI